MIAAVGGVVHSDYDLAWQQPLNSQVPLVDIGILRLRSAQVIAIGKTPLSQLAICLALGRRRALIVAVRKRIAQTHRCAVDRARVEVVGGEEHGRALTERGAWILEIGCNAHAVIHTCATANYCVLVKLVGETQARAPVVAINWNMPHPGGVGEERCPN